MDGIKTIIGMGDHEKISALLIALMLLKDNNKLFILPNILDNSNETGEITNSVGLLDSIIRDQSKVINLIKPYKPIYLNRKDRRKQKKRNGK